MRDKAWLLGVLFAIAIGGCGDDNGAGSGIPSVQNAFSSSACKKDTASPSAQVHIRSLNVIDNEAGLEGLRCVAWERVGVGQLKLDLYNFDATCGATWTGDGVVAADGTLALHVDNPGCQVAKCGICLYDWSFDLHVAVPAGQPVSLAVAVDACQGQQATVHSAAVIGTEPKGIRCTLASYGAMNWQADAAGTCGKAGMPCVGSLLCGTGSLASTGTCADGLLCDSSAAPNEPVCFVPCTTVADCPRVDVYTCQAGLCRPAGLAG
jgi:hypothetical protein